METVTVSPKYQIVILNRVCRSLGLMRGPTFQVIAYNNRNELVSLRPIREGRGLLRGIGTTLEREGDRSAY
jgi:hypothetical protein